MNYNQLYIIIYKYFIKSNVYNLVRPRRKRTALAPSYQAHCASANKKSCGWGILVCKHMSAQLQWGPPPAPQTKRLRRQQNQNKYDI